MKAFVALLSLSLLLACKRDAVEESAADFRGQPIGSASLTSNGPTANATKKIGQYDIVGFDKLASYKFEVSDELLAPQTNTAAMILRVDSQIPATVKAFNNKPVALTGFMLPLKVEGGLVTELLIMRDQSMCCYGVQPKINEWVSVKMTKTGVKPVMDQPVTLMGKLHVGEMRENGYLVGIYAMDGDKMEAPE